MHQQPTFSSELKKNNGRAQRGEGSRDVRQAWQRILNSRQQPQPSTQPINTEGDDPSSVSDGERPAAKRTRGSRAEAVASAAPPAQNVDSRRAARQSHRPGASTRRGGRRNPEPPPDLASRGSSRSELMAEIAELRMVQAELNASNVEWQKQYTTLAEHAEASMLDHGEHGYLGLATLCCTM
eukprot:SAG31_NODE_3374_length_4350_cov_4.769162_2_plen_182_part_00